MKKTETMIRLIVVFLVLASCQEKLPYVIRDNQVIIDDNGTMVTIAAITDDVIRVQHQSDSVYGDHIYGPVLVETQPFEIDFKGSLLSLRTDKVEVQVSFDPVRIRYSDRLGEIKLSEEQGYFERADTLGFRFDLQTDEAIYGTGSRAIPMNRRGERFMNYNRPQYGYAYGAKEINYNIPHIYSSEGYMLLIDNPAKAWFDIGFREKDVLEFASLGGNMAYYFINGESFSSLIDEYTDLTGKQPLPPIWAFGNLHSRFGYHSQEETEASVEKALDAGYPIDAVILDIYWFGPELENGQMGRLDWDLDNWPDPNGMIKRFSDQEINTITVSEPFFTLKSGEFENLASKNLLATTDDGEAATIPDFYFGEGGLLDIFKADAKNWIWERYKYMKSYGVEGWWVDLGEPEKHPEYMRHAIGTANEIHGVYGHEWAKMLAEGYENDYPGERLMHLGRSGFAGTQRYGLIPWSGDISRSWSGLQAQLPIMLGMGVSGLGYMHSDAGGFSNIREGDEELYTRWVQFAAFTPIFRPHADEIVPSEPVYWPEAVQQNVKPFVQLRYDLLPYHYTLAWDNMNTGMPMARPMFVSYPDLPDTLENQYMWGETLLVAPVLTQGLTEQEVFLPEGRWYDFWDETKVDGAQWYTSTLSMDKIPVFVKAGGIVPRTTGMKRTTNYGTADLELVYYVDNEPSSAEVYFDDGKTSGAFTKGSYKLISIQVTPHDGGITVTLDAEGDGYEGEPASRHIKLKIIGSDRPISSVNNNVKMNQEAYALVFDFNGSTTLELAYND